MATEWTTQIDVSESRLAETRRILSSSPRRTISITFTGLDKPTSARLLFEVIRSGGSDRRVPLYQDISVTTSSSSGTAINCPTAYRRFYVGQLVLIVEAGGTNPQYRTIGTVGASSITVTSALTGSYDTGSLVFPILVVDPILDATLDLITDDKGEINADYSESTSRLPAAGDWSGLTSYGFTQIDSFFYLLGVNPEWRNGVKFRMTKTGRAAVFSRIDQVVTWGPRATLSMDLTFSFAARADFWAFLQFFDAHRGRAVPFWLESPLSVWDPAAVSTTYLDVDQVGVLEDYTSFVTSIEGGSPFLLIQKTDGTKIISRITGVTEPGGGVFRLAATLPAMALADIERASLAFLVRFSTDALLEAWSNDSVCQVSTSVVEVLRWEDETSTSGNDGFFSGGVAQLCD